MTRATIRLALCAAVAATTLAVRASDALADVLVELNNGDQAVGTFLPSSEVETFLVRVPQGSTLNASVAGKRRRGAGPKPVMRLLDPHGAPVVTNALVTTPTGAKLTRYAVPESGVYALELTSDAEGDYAFKVKWKTPTSAKATVDFAPAATTTLTIHAPRDTVASFRLGAYAYETGAPRMVEVRAADDSFVHSFPPPPSPTSLLHAESGVHLAGSVDDYVVTLTETGDLGLALFTAKLVAPKSKPRRADLTSSVLGVDPRSNFVEGRVIGEEGGVVAAQSFDDDPLTGASVSVPPGALSSPSAIVIGPADEIDDGGDAEPYGPAVSFGPEGTEFAMDATVTLPYDAEAVGTDTEGLQVVTEDDDGDVSVMPEETYTVDPAAGTVSFPTSHFSTYQVFGPRRPGRSDVNGDGIDDLVIPAPVSGGSRGTVRVVYGGPDLSSRSSNDADVSIFGNGGGERFFGYLTAMGDVDDDGQTDLAVAAYGFYYGSYFGNVRVFKGGPGFGPQEAGDADYVFSTGPDETSAFTSLAIGDVTGDGKADLLVGSSTVGVDGVRDGAVWVVAGGPGFKSRATDDASVVRISGGVGDLRLGDAIATGDVTGDGIADIVIGAPSAFTSGNGSPGYVFVVPGGPSLASMDAVDLQLYLAGTVQRESFGSSIAVADFDGDGDVDVAVGAPARPAPGPGLAPGAVHLFAGPFSPFAKPPITTSVLVVAPPTLGSGAKGGGSQPVGTSLRAGNVVGDPTRDLIVGCPVSTPGGDFSAGALLVLKGGATFPTDVRIEAGSQQAAHLGCPVFPCADVDGDGRLDLIAAEPGADSFAGRAVIRTGPNLSGPMIVITGRAAESLGGPDCR